MKMYLYSVKDRLADEFAPLFEAKNDAIALRVHATMMAKVPGLILSDFELYKLGHYDSTNALVEGYETPLLINQVTKEV
nr:MAG: nonstructural protein [Microvirus sp.]